MNLSPTLDLTTYFSIKKNKADSKLKRMLKKKFRQFTKNHKGEKTSKNLPN